jgi:putative spermidine/putrescine transport system permease protein
MKLFKINKVRPYLYLLPSLLLFSLLIGYGLVMAGVESLSASPALFAHYEKVFAYKGFWKSVFISLYTALTATIASIVIGVWITRFFYRHFYRDHWKYIVWLPMLVPHFAAAYIIVLFFSQSGWLSSLAFQFGLIDDWRDFPIFIYDRSHVGIILTYIWKEVPFVVLMLLPVYQQLDHRYEDVVRTLGGKRWNVFTTVEFPWLWPVLIEIAVILFSFVVAAFEVPYLLGVTSPKMLPLLAFNWFYEGDWSTRPMAQALMMMITALTVSISLILLRISERYRYRLMKGKG